MTIKIEPGKKSNKNKNKSKSITESQHKKRSTKKKNRDKKTILKKLAKVIIFLTLCMTLLVSGFAFYIGKEYNPHAKVLRLQNIDKKITQQFTILDKDGKPLESNYESIKFDPVLKNNDEWNIDDLYIKTILATEDKGFYSRKTGYSIKGTLGAAASQVKSKLGKGGVARGGSTIEQQLVKMMVFGSNNQNDVSDKIIQLVDARKLAIDYSRDEILKAYMNELRLVPNTVGVKSASLKLFGNDMSNMKKTPENIAQIAFMAGLGQAPSVYTQNFNTAGKDRTKIILGIMIEDELISKKEYDQTMKFVKDKFQMKGNNNTHAPKQYRSYIAKVKNELAVLNLPNNAKVEVKTYADSDKLDQLYSVVNGEYPSDPSIPRNYIEHKESLIAISAVDSKTGHIVAISTNSDNPLIPFEANRSSGSTIKPLLDYAPAVEFAGLNEYTMQNGNPFSIGDWLVQNYGGTKYGSIKASDALSKSLNTAAVEAFRMTNDDQKNKIMEPLGLSQYNPNGGHYNPEQGINYPTNTLALASAFSSFGNDGVRMETNTIESIKLNGKNLKIEKPKSYRAMSSNTAKTVVNMLKGVVKPNGSEPYSAGNYTGIPESKYVIKSGLSNFDSNVPGGETKSPDALLAMASPKTSIAVWIGSPSYVSADYAPTTAPHEMANNARVYLMNSSMKILLGGEQFDGFKFGNKVLPYEDGSYSKPNIINVKDIDKSFSPEPIEITKDEKEQYKKAKEDLEEKKEEESKIYKGGN